MLPEALKELTLLPNWVVYRLIIDKNSYKSTKLPFDPINNVPAKVNDPNTWATYEIASNTFKNHSYDGIGFMIDNGYVGIDLDSCIDKFNEIDNFARNVISIVNSYTEFSPSNKGLHILCKSNTRSNINTKINRLNIEIYNNNRFFTITGMPYLDKPIMNRTSELEYLFDYIKR